MKNTTLFKKLIENKEILKLPCSHDALAARIAEDTGFITGTGKYFCHCDFAGMHHSPADIGVDYTGSVVIASRH